MWGSPWGRGRSSCKQPCKAACPKWMPAFRNALTANTAFQAPLLPFCVLAVMHLALVGASWETEGLHSAADGLAALPCASVLFHAKASQSSKAVACRYQGEGQGCFSPWSICCEAAIAYACSGLSSVGQQPLSSLQLRRLHQCHIFLCTTAFS